MHCSRVAHSATHFLLDKYTLLPQAGCSRTHQSSCIPCQAASRRALHPTHHCPCRCKIRARPVERYNLPAAAALPVVLQPPDPCAQVEEVFPPAAPGPWLGSCSRGRSLSPSGLPWLSRRGVTCSGLPLGAAPAGGAGLPERAAAVARMAATASNADSAAMPAGEGERTLGGGRTGANMEGGAAAAAAAAGGGLAAGCSS
jgi:hypothetical protein